MLNRPQLKIYISSLYFILLIWKQNSSRPVNLCFFGYMDSKLDNNLTISCVGLRRHSFSAPARLSLQRLELDTESLGVRVASLSSLVSAKSELLKTVEQAVTMRTCHGCHAPMDADHKGNPTGADQCPLEHWRGCVESIAEGTSGWRPCPIVSVPGSETEDSERMKKMSYTKRLRILT